MKILNYEEIIPKKYVIPTKLLKEYEDLIAREIPQNTTGRPRTDNQPLIAGMYFLLKTGCQWDALPLCFGPAKTVYHRFRELIKINAFQKIWKIGLLKYDQKIGLKLEHQSFDSNHRKSPLGGEKTGISPVDRKKLGTKINLATEGNGIPIGTTIEQANRHDTCLFLPLIKNLALQINQSRNHYLHADKGYLSAANKREAIARNYTPKMPIKKKKNKPRETQEKDKNRWVVERTFSWLSRFRKVFVRYDKLQNNYLSFVQFAFQAIIFSKI